MIRRATHDDLDRIEAIAAKCFPFSHWAGLLDYDRDAACESIAALIASPEAAVLFSEDGALAVIKCPLWFSREAVLTEYFFWALDGSGTALRQAAERWAAEQGLRIVLMGSHEPGQTDRIANWYRRGGYAPHGHTYRKVLHHGN